MLITITVTAADIARGKPGEACACPVYLALARALPHLGSMRAGPLYIGLTARVAVDTPTEASDFIARFDNGLPVEPFSFGLDVPGELLAAVTG